MRVALSMLVVVMLSSGCAGLIASTGKDLTVFQTKSELRAYLGEPTWTGVIDGEEFDEFCTRLKVADRPYSYASPGYAMVLFWTCGTCELLLVPYEFYRIGKGTVCGQTIRATYDKEGRVADLTLDREQLYPFYSVLRQGSQITPPSSQSTASDQALADPASNPEH